MANLENKYKDRQPKETIKIIEQFFINRGYNLILKDNYHCNSNIYWCRIILNFQGQQVLATNGKGTSEDYALASGYAELYERFCSQQLLLTNPFIYKKLQQLFPINNTITLDELLKDKTTNDFFNNFFNNRENFQSYLQMMIGEKLIANEFINIVNNEKKYFNLGLVMKFTASTGMAAGNTLEEALIQGISEWFERYVTGLVTLYNKNEIFYIINNNILPKYLQDIITNIELNNNYKIYIIDYSYNYNLPVCGVFLINSNNFKYYYTFGSAPTFEIATERCLTELYQGIYDNNLDNINYLQIPFKSLNKEKDSIFIRATQSVITRDFCPLESFNFKLIDSYNNKIFLKNNNYTNQDFLEHYKQILKDNNINLYYNDMSLCKEIKAIKLYSDNINLFNDIFNIQKISDSTKIELFNYMKICYQLTEETIKNNKSFIKINDYLNILKQISNDNKQILNDLFTRSDILNPYCYGNKVSNFSIMLNYLQTKKIDLTNFYKAKSFIIYFTIFNYYQYGYIKEEINKILDNFNIKFFKPEIEFCNIIEYIIYKTFLYITNSLYNDKLLSNYLQTFYKE